MKTLLILAVSLVTIQGMAQESKEKTATATEREKRSERPMLTPEQRASLQTKKMTLKYDLSEEQQEQVMAINLKDARVRATQLDERRQRMEERKNKDTSSMKRENLKNEKWSKEKRYELMSERLDKQIERKNAMKEILNDEQYQKWVDNLDNNSHKHRTYRNRAQRLRKSKNRPHRQRRHARIKDSLKH